MKINDLKNADALFRYDPETGFLFNKRTGLKAGYVNDRGYRLIEHNGTNYKAHRIAWTIYHGMPPTGQIDHINQEKDDNRIINLRDVDALTNRRNLKMHKSNTSGVTGVCFHKSKNKWRAKIKVKSKEIWLGDFDDFKKAVDVRHIAEIIYGFHENHGRK